MSEETSVGDTKETAGGNEEIKDESTQTSINPDDHKRALDDMHKFKKQSRDKDATITELQAKLQETESIRLREKEDYKGLYEKTAKELQNERERREQLKVNVLRSEKHRSVYPALKKAGLRDDAEKLLDNESFDDLEVETTSEGRFLVHGVESYVDRFKENYGFAFENKAVARINAGGANRESTISEENLTAAQMSELWKKDRDKFHKLFPVYLKNRNRRVSNG